MVVYSEYSEYDLNLIIGTQEYDVSILSKIKNYLRKIDDRDYILTKKDYEKTDFMSKVLYYMYSNDIKLLKFGNNCFRLTEDFRNYMKGNKIGVE